MKRRYLAQQKLQSSAYIEGVWGQSSQENFCGYTLYFGLEHFYDDILACAALELLTTLQQLFKLGSPVNFLSTYILWIRVLILRAIFIKTKWKTFKILQQFSMNRHSRKILRRQTLLCLSQSNFHGLKTVSLRQFFKSLSEKFSKSQFILMAKKKSPSHFPVFLSPR